MCSLFDEAFKHFNLDIRREHKQSPLDDRYYNVYHAKSVNQFPPSDLKPLQEKEFILSDVKSLAKSWSVTIVAARK